MRSTVARLVPLAVAVLSSSILLAGCGAEDNDGSPAQSLTVLYRSESPNHVRLYAAIKTRLAAADYEVESLGKSNEEYQAILEDPSGAAAGMWDIAVAGRAFEGAEGEDTFLRSLVNGEVEQSAPGDPSETAQDPAVLEQQILKDAALYPIAEPIQPLYASETVETSNFEAAFIPGLQNVDPALVRSTTAGRGKTLTFLGTGVGFDSSTALDPNSAYYSISYLGLRLWTRQLYSFSQEPTRPSLDLAADDPTQISSESDSSGTTTFEITLKPGQKWSNGDPVVGADFERGVKRICLSDGKGDNPGQDRFRELIVGLADFCRDLRVEVPVGLSPQVTVQSVKTYLQNKVDGLVTTADTIRITFAQPGMSADQARAVLALPAFSPVHRAILEDPPGQIDPENLVANGPYQVRSFVPGKQLVFEPNPEWVPIGGRRANFDRVVVKLDRKDADAIQRSIGAASEPTLAWDTALTTEQFDALSASEQGRVVFVPTFALDPYLAFNTTGGALIELTARERLVAVFNEAAIREALLTALGGCRFNRALDGLLPSDPAEQATVTCQPDPAPGR